MVHQEIRKDILFINVCIIGFAVAPLVLVVLPLIIDLATGFDQPSDIMIRRAEFTEQISL